MTELVAPQPLLEVRDLWVEHRSGGSEPWHPLIRGATLDLAAGETVALVGPSGGGKSLLARAALGLLAPGFRWRGEVAWQGRRLLDPAGAAWQRLRGRGLSLIPQEPLASLNPVLTAGEQIAEVLQFHRGLAASAARRATLDLLTETMVPDPERTARSYAHQLSGGMRQRVLLAAALASDPALLIADEPTTALDVSVQKEILALIKRIQRERQMALLFITHDLVLASLLVDRVAFMAGGRITEILPVGQVKLPKRPAVCISPSAAAEPVFTAQGLVVRYPRLERSAVSGVDLNLYSGRATGLLGESGCGKTSLGRALAGHLALSRGVMSLAGQRCPARAGGRRREQRRQVQMLFQDPGGSLDPRQTVGAALHEAVGPSGSGPVELLAEVGLAAEVARRYPHQLSGGQRQRVALARCLAPAPTVLIADEPTSALDAGARDQVLQLLVRIMEQRGLAMLIISHDLEVLRGVCAEIQVMYAGLVVEVLPGDDLFVPRHPYTQELQAAVPRALRGNTALWGQTRLHSPSVLPQSGRGCPRCGLCPVQNPHCDKELPLLKMVSDGHWLRCPVTETTGASHFIDTL